MDRNYPSAGFGDPLGAGPGWSYERSAKARGEPQKVVAFLRQARLLLASHLQVMPASVPLYREVYHPMLLLLSQGSSCISWCMADPEARIQTQIFYTAKRMPLPILCRAMPQTITQQVFLVYSRLGSIMPAVPPPMPLS
ncbi:hypothetical protein E2320_002889 [Naja naja]|nr:hypothetical protein E2320_002889 [Naja naja]